MDKKPLLHKERFSLKKFFFPFSPIKAFRSLRLIFLMAILIALRVVLGFAVIPIKPIGLSISLAWVPVMVIGWYFGPVAGLVLGLICDTLNFLTTGGVWFWLYAIQEPIVGLVAGLIAGFYRYRKSKEKINIQTDIIISQVVTVLFIAFSYIILLKWLDPKNFGHDKPAYVDFYNIYKWVALSLLLVFFVLYETFTIVNLTRKKKETKHMLSYVYASCLVIVLMATFSFALGPITAVKYAQFVGAKLPSGYLEYGSIFYLVPRVALEAIKVPVEIGVLFGIITLCDSKVKNLVYKINSSWENK